MSADKTVLDRLKLATCSIILLVAVIGWFAAVMATFNMEGPALGKAGILLTLVFIFAYAMTYVPFAGGHAAVPSPPPPFGREP